MVKPTFQTNKPYPFFLIFLKFIYLRSEPVSIILEDNARIVTEERGINDVMDAINTHAGCPELIEAAAAVLLSLSIEGTIHFKNIRGYVECLFFFFYTEENKYSFVSGQYEKTEICRSTCCGCLLKKKIV